MAPPLRLQQSPPNFPPLAAEATQAAQRHKRWQRLCGLAPSVIRVMMPIARTEAEECNRCCKGMVETLARFVKHDLVLEVIEEQFLFP